MLQGDERSARSAKQLRREMSPPERLLWSRLRQRPSGIKFRNQHPAGPYVADFYCHEHRLIIEIDGVAHDMGDRPSRDLKRDHWFQYRGLRVVRYSAKQVLADPDGVAESILAVCLAAAPPSALWAATSPRGGDSAKVPT